MLVIILCGLSLQAQALIYTPKNFNASRADLVVVLHGCMQPPEAMQASTGFDKIADERNWIVLYPRAPWGHLLGCWSWYQSENQKPDSGELARLFEEIEEVRAKYKLGGKVFATGISSGGTTVAGLMACYPDLLDAAAIHSAPAYASATSGSEALRVMERGPSAITGNAAPCAMSDFQGRTLVLHGTSDSTVNPDHADHIVASVLEGGRFRLEQENGEEGGREYARSRYFKGKTLKAEVVMIEGLGHAWSGAESSTYSYFDTKGPSAAKMISEFFKPEPPQARAARRGPSPVEKDCSKLVER